MSRRRRDLLRWGTAALLGGIAGCTSGTGRDPGTASRTTERNTTERDTTEPATTTTAEPTADGPQTETETSTPADVDPIPVGSVLPLSGVLGPYGDGMQAAVELAAADVNDAGGPLGRPIELHERDSETRPKAAVTGYESLVDEADVVGIVGAAASNVSVALARRTAADGVMQVSNASTAPALAGLGYGDDGDPPKYAGRTAPNDAQQGVAMAWILDEHVGAETAAFLYVDNPYGRALAEAARRTFRGETVGSVGYSKAGDEFASTLSELHEGDPDGVGFVGYPATGGAILQQLADGDYGTTAADWVLSDGFDDPGFLGDHAGVVGGAHVASPAPERTAGTERFRAKIGGENTLFAAHAYDALFLQALAVERAGEASGTAIAENLRAVAAPGGTTVTVGEFGKAREIISSGGEVDYQGASSPLVMTRNLEPLTPVDVVQVEDDGSRTAVGTVPRRFFRGKLRDVATATPRRRATWRRDRRPSPRPPRGRRSAW